MTAPQILLEDKQLLVLNKPAGLMVEKDRFGNPCVLSWAEDYLKRTAKGDIFVANVHRLDRPASGVLLLVKKKSALKILSEQFRQRAVEKIYYAVTQRAPAIRKGQLIHWLLKDPEEKKAHIFPAEKKDAQRVELYYEVIEENGSHFLWKIRLITGKYHQIRAQLAYSGCPITGDVKYGAPESLGGEKICLHAGNLKIVHPVNNSPVSVRASFPVFTPWSLFNTQEPSDF